MINQEELLQQQLITTDGYLHLVATIHGLNGNNRIYLGILSAQNYGIFYGLLINDPIAHAYFINNKNSGNRVRVTSLGELELGVVTSHRTIEDLDMSAVHKPKIVGYNIETPKGDIIYMASDEQI